MFRSRAVSLALVGLFVWATGCHKWVPLEAPYAPSEYEQLRVTGDRGEQVVLKEARLEADTVWGTTVTSYWERGDLKHSEQVAAISIDSVQKIEKRGGDTAATVGLVVGIVGAVSLLSLAMGGDMFEGCAFGELPSGECRPLWDDDPSN